MGDGGAGRAIITSALPYANGEIHLGHVASTYLPADVTARFLRQRGVEAYYVCASDDYGTPILVQSEREGKTPEEYAGHWNRRAREDFAALDISFDMFYRTSSPENAAFARDVFERLRRAGHIYERVIVQFYCERDAKFLPDRYVRGGCPHCGAADQYSDSCEACGRIPDEIVDPRCALCGDRPVKRESSHHFFRLSGFGDRLARWLEGNANLQPDVKRYVLNWIDAGLVDWDITRDIPWGVPVPGGDGDGKVFYGWFDNHLAYISTAVKALGERGIGDGRGFWNSADIYHFIGKDIVYHHYLFLPAMRMGLGEGYFKLPDYIPTRGHLTLGSRKISKSRGWYVGLAEFLSMYPADYLRYYLVVINPYSQDDVNFDWDEFAVRINSELIGNLGNFVNRALGFAYRRFGGAVPAPGGYDDDDPGAEERIRGLAAGVGGLAAQGHLDRALRALLDFTGYFNRYFQHKEPWKAGAAAAGGGGAGGTSASAATCVYLSANAVRSTAVALSPFLPGSARRMWAQLGMEGDPSEQPWDSASELGVGAGHRIGGEPSPLFARVEAGEIERCKARMLGGLGGGGGET